MAISQSRKASALFLVLTLGGGICFAFFPAAMASRESRRFCGALTLGMPLAEIQSRAAAAGYRFEPVVGGHVLVEHPKSLGRAYCELGFDDKGRLASKLDAN